MRVTRFDTNRGKGAAVLAGFGLARAAGFSHCLQVDADGQHDMTAVADMLALAQNRPEAVVAGWAIYDGSAPLGRVMGRWITHVCVWIETLSFGIRDSMCGLRVYPLAAVAALIDQGAGIGEGMDFDTEIIVRLHRAGTPVVNHPVRVAYPPGNLSNFRMWRDNWRITRMHTRLLLGTLFTWPALLWQRRRRAAPATHWAGLAERGLYWGLQISAWAYRLLGRRGCMAVLAPVVLYFYLTAGERRRASLDFLARAFAASGRSPPGWWDGYRHFMSFARRALDSFIAWMGRMPADAVVPVEVERARGGERHKRAARCSSSPITAMSTSRAPCSMPTRGDASSCSCTRAMRRTTIASCASSTRKPPSIPSRSPKWAPTPPSRSSKGSKTATGCSLPAIARRSAAAGGPAPRRSSALPAEFSQGPYLMAALLDCPVYLFFCRREGERYGLRVERLAERIVLPRGRRGEALAAYAATYAARLEKHVLEDPFQWYNFYDFWRPSGSTVPP